MLLWIVGKTGLLSRAFQRMLDVPFVATSKEEVDCIDKESIERFLSMTPVTHIINCSGYTAVDLAEEEEREAFMLNVIGPANLASFDLPIVHFSTDYVFDGSKEGAYTETCKPNPLNIYGQTKLEGEKAVLKNPRSIVLRISWLFSREGIHFVSSMKRLMEKHGVLNIVSDQRGRPTYAEDVVFVTNRLIAMEAHGLFHYANEGETTWYEFAQQIKTHLKSSCQLIPTSTEQYGARALRPKNSVLSTEKIEKLLGEKPPLWHNRLPEVFS